MLLFTKMRCTVFLILSFLPLLNGRDLQVEISPNDIIRIPGYDIIEFTCRANVMGTVKPIFNWTGPVTNGTITTSSGQNIFEETLNLGYMRESFVGEYICTVSLGSSSAIVSSRLESTPITAFLSISSTNSSKLFDNYSLTCGVPVPTLPLYLMISSPHYQWRRNGEVVAGATSRTLDLSPLQGSEDNAVYSCQYLASSEFLNGLNLSSATHRINITFIPPSAPFNVMGSSLPTSVTLSWSKLPLDFVTNYIINYTIINGCPNTNASTTSTNTTIYTLNKLDENTHYAMSIYAINKAGISNITTYNIMTQSAAPSCCIPEPVLQSVNATSFTVTWDREPCTARNGAERYYTVRYYKTESGNIIKSETTTIDNRSFTAMFLSPHTSYQLEVALVNVNGTGPFSNLTIKTFGIPFFTYINSMAYPNNSLVNLEDIGSNDNVLFCFTNLENCCRNSDSDSKQALGSWWSPDNASLPLLRNAITMEFSQSRTKGAIILYHGMNANRPSGIYTCEIPDDKNNTIFVYIGIYHSMQGFSEVSLVTYNTSSDVLTCISTGGPATTVTWSRSGPSYQQSKIVVDTKTATYHNLLSITSSQISDYTGTFTCTVSNRRGSSSMTTGDYKSIEISGTKTVYKVGSSASFICYSNLSVDSIEWLDIPPNNSSYIENTGTSTEILLHITNISGADNGTKLACEMTYLLASGVKSTSRITTILNIEDILNRITNEATAEKRDYMISTIVLAVVLAVTFLTFLIIIFVLLSSKARNTRYIQESNTKCNIVDDKKVPVGEQVQADDNTLKASKTNDIEMFNCQAYGDVKMPDTVVKQHMEAQVVYEAIQ